MVGVHGLGFSEFTASVIEHLQRLTLIYQDDLSD